MICVFFHKPVRPRPVVNEKDGITSHVLQRFDGTSNAEPSVHQDRVVVRGVAKAFNGINVLRKVVGDVRSIQWVTVTGQLSNVNAVPEIGF